MSRNIPFFEFFAELSASPELRLRLAGAELAHGRIDQGERSMELDMMVKSPLDQGGVQSLEETLRAAYMPPLLCRKGGPYGGRLLGLIRQRRGLLCPCSIQMRF